jgi:branched-chain amino acid transport system ATP-binding protein
MMLEVKDVSLAYGPVMAVRNVSIAVEAGQIVSVVGANGAGKSTLMKGIVGLVPVSGGTILFDGKDVTGLAAHRRVAMGIGLSPEGRQVFPDQSVHDNLVLGAYFRKLDAAALTAAVERQYALFPRLRERRDQLAVTLSGGEQQMLAIGRALMGTPRLLLLDEPSLGLAPKITHEIFEIIRSLKKTGITIILVEQAAALALAVADHAYVLETGAVTLKGTGRELLTNAKVRAAYLGAAKTG